MTKLTIRDRLSYAVIGAVFGVFVGALAAWLIGGNLYGESAGFAGVIGTAKQFLLGFAAICGVVGFFAGPSVGSVAGALIAGLFHIHMSDDRSQHLPDWFVAVFLVAAAFAVWWWLS